MNAKSLIASIGVIAALLLTQTANAQQASEAEAKTQGPPGIREFRLEYFRVSSLLELAKYAEVKKEIGLTDAEKLEALRNERQSAASEVRRQAISDRGEVPLTLPELSAWMDKRSAKRDESRKRLNEEYDSKLEAELTVDQFARLKQIFIQVGRLDALAHAIVAKDLRLTEDQVKEIERLRVEWDREWRRILAETSRKANVGPRYAEGAAALRHNNEQMWNQATSVLTPEQTQMLDALKGKSFDISRLVPSQTSPLPEGDSPKPPQVTPVAKDQALGDAATSGEEIPGGSPFARESFRVLSLLDLARIAEVKKEIGLIETKDVDALRNERLKAINAESPRPDIQRFRGLPPDHRRAYIEVGKAKLAAVTKKVNEEFDLRLATVITTEQFARLQGVFIQVAGVEALAHAMVAKELGLSSEQAKQIGDVRAEWLKAWEQAFHEAYRTANGAPRFAEGAAALHQINEEMLTKATNILTAEQKEKLVELKGTSFDISRLVSTWIAAPPSRESPAPQLEK